MTQSVKDEAKFLDTRLDDETAAVLEKWNLAILGAALLHDADHIRQAIRWRYKIPMQLWIINLAVYVLPTVAEFLLKNKRTSSFLTAATNGIVTSAAFLKVHLFKPTTDIWGTWNYNYFKLAKGVWHEGQFIKGIDWIDWAARPARRGHPGVHDGDQKAQGIQAEPAGSGRRGLMIFEGERRLCVPLLTWGRSK